MANYYRSGFMSHRRASAPPSQLIQAHLSPAIGLCTWEDLDRELQAQVSQALQPNTTIESIVYPSTPAALSQVMELAHHHDWRILHWGAGTKLGWGGLAETIHLGLSTARLNRLIDHAVGDLTVTVEAGMRVAELQATLAKEDQFLPIDPLHADRATIGGIIATADTGGLRQRYGGIRDLLIGVSFVRADGQLARAGGRVVKNVAGYDLMKLLTGSYGTLGVICEATLRVYPLPAVSQAVVLSGSPKAIARLTHRLLSSALTPTAVELIAPQTAAKLGLTLSLGIVVRFQGIGVSVAQQAHHLEQWGHALGVQSSVVKNGDEAALWQQLTAQMQGQATEPAVTCKIGVLPINAVATLTHLSQLSCLQTAVLHAGSGLGLVRLDRSIEPATLQQIRQQCEAQGGFLTLLDAPTTLKQHIEVWGYTGEALAVMQRLKAQFDPTNRLNPNRFVGGI